MEQLARIEGRDGRVGIWAMPEENILLSTVSFLLLSSCKLVTILALQFLIITFFFGSDNLFVSDVSFCLGVHTTILPENTLIFWPNDLSGSQIGYKHCIMVLIQETPILITMSWAILANS